MLPWKGPLEFVRSPDCYTSSEVAGVLSAAARLNLQVVPLLQTFGHLEYVLKHSCMAHLREDPDNYMDLCPQKPGARELVTEMLRQVVEFHLPFFDATDGWRSWGARDQLARGGNGQPDIPGPTAAAQTARMRVHIGGDEVFGLGTCPSCAAECAKGRQGRNSLFVSHIAFVLQQCQAHGVKPMMWHDMLTHVSVPELQHSGLSSISGGAEVVVWAYGTEIEDQIASDLWDRLGSAGLKVWGASAWRGASQPDAIWTPADRHAANHCSWVRRARRTKLQGMILTGWSRFNHIAALCETLPAGLPSLALAFSILTHGEDGRDRRHCTAVDATYHGGHSHHLIVNGGQLMNPVHTSTDCDGGAMFDRASASTLLSSAHDRMRALQSRVYQRLGLNPDSIISLAAAASPYTPPAPPPAELLTARSKVQAKAPAPSASPAAHVLPSTPAAAYGLQHANSCSSTRSSSVGSSGAAHNAVVTATARRFQFDAGDDGNAVAAARAVTQTSVLDTSCDHASDHKLEVTCASGSSLEDGNADIDDLIVASAVTAVPHSHRPHFQKQASLTPSVSGTGPYLELDPTSTSDTDHDDEVRYGHFPGIECYRALAILEQARLQLAKCQENRKLYLPPYTLRLQLSLARRVKIAFDQTGALLGQLLDPLLQGSLASPDVAACFTPLAHADLLATKALPLRQEALDASASIAAVLASAGGLEGHVHEAEVPQWLTSMLAATRV